MTTIYGVVRNENNSVRARTADDSNKEMAVAVDEMGRLIMSPMADKAVPVTLPAGPLEVVVVPTRESVRWASKVDIEYVGSAPVGSDESDPVWDIERTTLNLGDPVAQEWALSVAWTDRETVIYG